ncbi:MAG: bifunctional alpha,alpha-trehalose-phosphate synthase (UDP-forming)/trehalose-phosphatase [Bacteroidota bacterium]
MSRIVIISNRLPVTIKKEENELIYYPSAGGLATGLNSLDKSIDRIWIGWPGQEINDPHEQETVTDDLRESGLVPVFLTQEDTELYYEGFSNKVIWPHFHYFTQYTTYRDDYWEAYKAVNRKFADVVIPQLKDGDMVWVQDYQLLLLPAMIRAAFPDISIGFFLHIPFPSYEIFRILPWREEILNGVLGADQIGFHTFNYMRHFLSAAYRITGYEHNFGRLKVGHRVVNVDVFPMGIDYEKYAHPQLDDSTKTADVKHIKALAKDRRLIISIDRLDYTKGIPQRVRAFAQFVRKHPEYHRKVSLVMIVVPSRSNVDQYQELKHEIDTLSGELNSTYGSFVWTPIKYFYRSLNFRELTTLYRLADVAMITPLRDGMNLVAKEYIASKEDNKRGVLILSEMAGASNELTEAILINPQDQNDIESALIQALEMPKEEQRQRLEIMQEKLKRYDVRHWANTFINEQKKLMQSQLEPTTNLLNEAEQQQLLDAYKTANKRLVVLDYDGTLMNFDPDPQAVVPDEALINILQNFQDDPKNKLVVSSGRDRETLQKWLEHIGMDFSAEHGVWMKRNDEWQKPAGLASTWKPKVRGLLENLVERTPGSFIEEKQYSIAWHYRRIDKDLGEKRVREFRDMLVYLTANLDLQVLEGNKVVEIKNAGVNKGKAILNWLNDADYDFILAVGDDHTDEDTFRAMPDDAYTIKVGLEKTDARFNLVSVEQVRAVLNKLIA